MGAPEGGGKLTCRRCRAAEATGVIFALCAPCYETFAAQIEANLDPDGRYALSDEEFEYLNEGVWPLPDGRLIEVKRKN